MNRNEQKSNCYNILMQLYNTATRTIEKFEPLHPPEVKIYSCGPTVYDFTHIGHARTYINTDVLKRTLLSFGYQVSHIMNVTDVGHLTGDDDTGEDKLEEGAKKAGKSVWDIAAFYTDFFMKTVDSVNIMRPDMIVRATDHIQDMIKLIKKLQEKDYVYQTDQAAYFDTSKFKSYGKLSGQPLEEKKQQARQEVYIDPQKKNPTDFVLWFKRVGRFSNHTMHWESPWGDGFPGWHIECSAMSMKYLGETIDIHTGGVDHVPVHHENEIAQSEAATEKLFVQFWFHNEFLLVDGKKMSKSLGNFYTIDDIEKKGINPLALRFLFLQTHYRKQLNFTWEAVQAAQEGLNRLMEQVAILQDQVQRSTLSNEKLGEIDSFNNQFSKAISNDLQTPQALAIVWEMLKSNIPSTDKLDLLLQFDRIFGLQLAKAEKEIIPADILELAQSREEARKNGDFEASDKIRKQLQEKGYVVEDLPDGFRVKKI